MIAYTLLSTSRKKDVINVVLTTLILYALLCYAVPSQYRYYSVSGILLVDMILIKKGGLSETAPAPQHKSHKRHRRHKSHKSHRGHRRVRINPVPMVHYIPPSSNVPPAEPPLDEHSPAYRLSKIMPQQPAGPPAYVMPYVAPQPIYEPDESSSSSEDIPISETSSEITFSSEEL